jgi:hypothetical protein
MVWWLHLAELRLVLDFGVLEIFLEDDEHVDLL